MKTHFALLWFVTACDSSLFMQSFRYVGIEITWVGEGVEEIGHAKGDPENVLVRVDPRYFRPTEVDLLLVSYRFGPLLLVYHDHL